MGEAFEHRHQHGDGDTEPSRRVLVRIERILAPNPSPMTLEGTNTYVISTPTFAIVVDPGPVVDAHLSTIMESVRRAGLTPRGVLTTHSHPDHAEAAEPLASMLGCDVYSSGRGAKALAEAMDMAIVALPGHAGDHVGFLTPDGQLLTGDHVLGRGTSAIIYPEGSLEAYFASLSTVAALAPRRLLPGHGPAIERDSIATVLTFLEEHRRARIGQVRDLVTEGLGLADTVRRIYGDLGDPIVTEAAVRQTLATLVWLQDHEAPEVAQRARAIVAAEGPHHASLPSDEVW